MAATTWRLRLIRPMRKAAGSTFRGPCMSSSSREHRAPVRYGLKPTEIREIATSLQARGNRITDIDIQGLSKRFGCAAKTIHEIAERLGCTITSVDTRGAGQRPGETPSWALGRQAG